MVNKTNNDPLTLSASIYCPHQENTAVVTDVLGNTVCLIFTKQDMILVEFVLQFETTIKHLLNVRLKLQTPQQDSLTVLCILSSKSWLIL